mgnify:CR=1 FL=1
MHQEIRIKNQEEMLEGEKEIGILQVHPIGQDNTWMMCG